METMNEFEPVGSSGQSAFEPRAPRAPGENLPRDYGKDVIRLMVVDPYWLHTYWMVTSNKKEELKSALGEETCNASRFILRVYDVTDVIFDGDNAHSYFDINIMPEARNWYINTGSPDRNYLVDIGLVTPEGRFVFIARSNVIRVPRDSVSDVVDDRWMTLEKDYSKLFRLSGGELAGKSSIDIRELINKRMHEHLFSGVVSSFGSQTAGAEKKEEEKTDFWMWLNTELIVYGATEPDAGVTVQGKQIKLRPDGSFTLRYALPEGKQVIPVRAESADGEHQREITPVVSRETR